MSERLALTALPRERKRERGLLSFLGPGFITGAADDDPSGIAVFSQTGAQFGLQLLWLAPLVFPLMLCVQEMSARIGLVSGRGIVRILRDEYPPYVVWLVGVLTVPAVMVNIGADLLAMGAVLHMLMPGVSTSAFSILCAGAIVASLLICSYERIASLLQWTAFVLFVYVLVPFFVRQNWMDVLHSAFVPQVDFTSRFAIAAAAFFGTNISAYLLFWESSLEVEDRARAASIVTRARLSMMRKDNAAGMSVAALIMFFVVWACGTALHPAGVTQIRSVNEAALALAPIAGNAASLLFAVGILASGFIAVPVLAASCGYIASEAFGIRGGLGERVSNAKRFYTVIVLAVVVSLVVNVVGVGAIQALVFAAVVYGIMAPPAIYFIIRIGSNRRIMGEFRNGVWSNAFGVLTLLIMIAVSVLLIYTLVV